MPRIRPLFYGWYDEKRRKFFVSFFPADCPRRRPSAFDSMSEVAEMLVRKRANVMWWPPLPADLEDEFRLMYHGPAPTEIRRI